MWKETEKMMKEKRGVEGDRKNDEREERCGGRHKK